MNIEMKRERLIEKIGPVSKNLIKDFDIKAKFISYNFDEKEITDNYNREKLKEIYNNFLYNLEELDANRVLSSVEYFLIAEALKNKDNHKVAAYIAFGGIPETFNSFVLRYRVSFMNTLQNSEEKNEFRRNYIDPLISEITEEK